jgi:XRE family transcriptional regulator, fatty acid utilization regulator
MADVTLDRAQERAGRRIKWLREERRMTQEALSSAMGFNDRQSLSNIENGKRKVSPREMAVAARALGVPLDALTDPFRLVGEGGFSFRAEGADAASIDAFAEQAGRWIATYRELGRLAGVPTVRLSLKLELRKDSSFEEVASGAEHLCARWQLGDTPAATIEQAIERELGTQVLYVDAPRGISGAASYLPGSHTILINRSESRGRRSFDFAHELFHLLTWDVMPPERVEQVTLRPTKGNRVEQLANVFASNLLMPETVVRARWAEREDKDVEKWTLATARRFRVSPIALQWRLYALRLAAQPDTGHKLVESRTPFEPTPTLFNAVFVGRVHDAVEDGRLSLRRAAAVLGMNLKDFAQLCATYGRQLSYAASDPPSDVGDEPAGGRGSLGAH